MRKLLAIVALVAVIVGCSTAVKQVYYTATGPQGSYLLVSAESPSALSKYKVLEVAKFENALPGVIEPVLVSLVQRKTVEEMSESGYFQSVVSVPAFKKAVAKAPTLVLRGKLVDIVSDKIPGQKLISGGNYIVAAVEVVDKSTGAVLVKGNVRGEVKSVAQTGDESFAEGMAKGVRKLFKKVLGKEEK